MIDEGLSRLVDLVQNTDEDEIVQLEGWCWSSATIILEEDNWCDGDAIDQYSTAERTK